MDQILKNIFNYVLLDYTKQRGRASHSEAWPLTRRPGLLQRGQASHSEAGPLTGRPGLLQRGLTSHREAGPLIKFSKLTKNSNKNIFFS